MVVQTQELIAVGLWPPPGGSHPTHPDMPPEFDPAVTMAVLEDMYYDTMPCDTEPVGNTAVDKKDDNVWGAVIRAHFNANAANIVEAARWSPNRTEPKLLKELQEMLRRHGFEYR